MPSSSPGSGYLLDFTVHVKAKLNGQRAIVLLDDKALYLEITHRYTGHGVWLLASYEFPQQNEANNRLILDLHSLFHSLPSLHSL